jgi:hypothetical protein
MPYEQPRALSATLLAPTPRGALPVFREGRHGPYALALGGAFRREPMTVAGEDLLFLSHGYLGAVIRKRASRGCEGARVHA